LKKEKFEFWRLKFECDHVIYSMHANPKKKKKKKKRQKEERELEEEDHLGQEILIPEKNAFMVL